MQVFHGGSAENDEEADPECGALEGDGLVDTFVVLFIVSLEDHGIKKKRDEAEDESQFNEEDRKILGVVLNAAPGLRGDDLIHIVEIDASGEQEDDQQNTGDLLVVLVEDVRDRLDLFFRNRLLESWSDRHDEERQPADPDDGRQEMEPMVDDWDQRIEIGGDALEGVHLGQC